MKIPVKVYEKLGIYWMRDLQERGIVNEHFEGNYTTEVSNGNIYLVTIV